jgi:hypothetical protein
LGGAWDDGGMMKLKGWAMPLVLVLLGFLSGCASAPTSWEQKFFDICRAWWL